MLCNLRITTYTDYITRILNQPLLAIFCILKKKKRKEKRYNIELFRGVFTGYLVQMFTSEMKKDV